MWSDHTVLKLRIICFRSQNESNKLRQQFVDKSSKNKLFIPYGTSQFQRKTIKNNSEYPNLMPDSINIFLVS